MTLLGSVRKFYNAPSGISITASVLPCLERQASVPHDYIYGFLGLVTSEERSQVTIDYRLPHWTVYRDFFELLISTAGPDELRLLAMISLCSQSTERPSWLPDFSSQRDAVRSTGMYLASEMPFCAVEEVWWSDDNEILMLRGVHLDVIAETHDMQDTYSNWVDHMMTMAEEVSSRGPALESLTGPPQPLLDACKDAHVSQLFLGNIQPDGGVETTDTQVQTCWTVLDAHHRAGMSIKNLDNVEYKQSRANLGGLSVLTISSRIAAQAFIVCGGRKLVISQASLVGICVPDARPGDHIVCLYGFHMPFVLRPCNGHFRIIGGTFMHGLKDWEVMYGCLERGDMTEATYRIR